MGKMAHISALARASIALLFTSYLAGCSYLPSPSLPWFEPAPVSDPSAEAIFQQGMDHLNNKRYARAIIQFEKVRDEFPFSSQVNEAELKTAEAYYLNKQYPEAALGFKDFLALHPTNKKVPFIIYHLGLVYFDQFTGIDQDQKNVETAKGYFETLIKEHPNSSYFADAKEKLAKCREYLAGREFYVGSFYLRQKKYSAARDRFKIILRRYRDTPVGIMALYQLGEIYRVEKNNVKASLAYRGLIQHYPDSPLAKKARIQLSQLDKEDQDPLAILLMRDGRPVFMPPPESGQQKEAARVAKKEVVKEEGGVQKGFFRTIADTVNPFSSSDEKDEADKKKENGKEESGFLSGLWPFGKDKKEEGKILEQDNDRLLGGVDESLKEKGVLKTKYSEAGKQNPQDEGQNPNSEIENLDIRPPASDLPQVTEEALPSDPAEVLGDIDERLEKGGKKLGELPPPPEASSKLFVTRPSTSKKKKSTALSPSTIGLLDSIDKGLKTKGIEAPKAGENARTLGSLEASQPSSIPASQPYVEEKVELTPRFSTEKSPLFDAGDFQLKEKPQEAEKTRKREGSDASKQAGVQASEPLKEPPPGVVKGPPPLPSEEKPAEKKPAAKKSEDEEQGALDQIKEELKSIGDLLNPFSW